MRVIRGPWQWVTDAGESFWAPPEGYAGLDLRSVEEQSTAGGTPGLGIFCGKGKTDDNYDLLGTGSLRDIKVSKKIRDAIPGKYRPNGDDLLGLLLDVFTDGSDPDGIDGPKPLLPTTRKTIELHFGGQSHFERFQWGDRRTGKIKDVLRRDFDRTMTDSVDGKLKDKKQHQRVLDALCDKYDVDDWKEFVPTNRQKDVPGRVKHETTYTDDFNRADSTGLGAGWSTVFGSGFDVASNQCRGTNATNSGTRARYQSDVSSSDHYTQANNVSYGDSAALSAGVCARYSNSADTSYAWVLRLGATPSRRLFRFSASTGTLLASDSVTSVTGVVKIEVNGSSIKVYVGGVEVTALATTDTSITSGTRGGINGQQHPTSTTRTVHDDFEITDLTPSGILYTRLESGVRGVTRGVYTRNGG
jgi:hypothetical protein